MIAIIQHFICDQLPVAAAMGLARGRSSDARRRFIAAKTFLPPP
jgi:hypothetical protein